MLEVIKKEKSSPCNYAAFVVKGTRGALHNVTLYEGQAISCSTCRRATSLDTCQHMQAVNALPDKDLYWEPFQVDDFSDLFDE